MRERGMEEGMRGLKKLPVKLIKKRSGKGYTSYMIYFPKKIIEELGYDKYEYLILEVDRDERRIVIKPLE